MSVNNPDIPNPVTLAKLDEAISDASLRVIARDSYAGILTSSQQLTADSMRYQRCVLFADANIDLPSDMTDGWDIVFFNESAYNAVIRTAGGGSTLVTILPQQMAVFLYAEATWTFRRIPSLAAKNTFSVTQTFKAVKETVYPIVPSVAFIIDPNNGGIQTINLTSNPTPVAENWESGQSVSLYVSDGGGHTINWSALGVVWDSGLSEPTLVTTGYTVITLTKIVDKIHGVW